MNTLVAVLSILLISQTCADRLALSDGSYARVVSLQEQPLSSFTIMGWVNVTQFTDGVTPLLTYLSHDADYQVSFFLRPDAVGVLWGGPEPQNSANEDIPERRPRLFPLNEIPDSNKSRKRRDAVNYSEGLGDIENILVKRSSGTNMWVPMNFVDVSDMGVDDLMTSDSRHSYSAIGSDDPRSQPYAKWTNVPYELNMEESINASINAPTPFSPKKETTIITKPSGSNDYVAFNWNKNPESKTREENKWNPIWNTEKVSDEDEPNVENSRNRNNNNLFRSTTKASLLKKFQLRNKPSTEAAEKLQQSKSLTKLQEKLRNRLELRRNVNPALYTYRNRNKDTTTAKPVTVKHIKPSRKRTPLWKLIKKPDKQSFISNKPSIPYFSRNKQTAKPEPEYSHFEPTLPPIKITHVKTPNKEINSVRLRPIQSFSKRPQSNSSPLTNLHNPSNKFENKLQTVRPEVIDGENKRDKPTLTKITHRKKLPRFSAYKYNNEFEKAMENPKLFKEGDRAVVYAVPITNEKEFYKMYKKYQKESFEPKKSFKMNLHDMYNKMRMGEDDPNNNEIPDSVPYQLTLKQRKRLKATSTTSKTTTQPKEFKTVPETITETFDTTESYENKNTFDSTNENTDQRAEETLRYYQNSFSSPVTSKDLPQDLEISDFLNDYFQDYYGDSVDEKLQTNFPNEPQISENVVKVAYQHGDPFNAPYNYDVIDTPLRTPNPVRVFESPIPQNILQNSEQNQFKPVLPLLPDGLPNLQNQHITKPFQENNYGGKYWEQETTTKLNKENGNSLFNSFNLNQQSPSTFYNRNSPYQEDFETTPVPEVPLDIHFETMPYYFKANMWYHLGLTWDATSNKATIYINGEAFGVIKEVLQNKTHLNKGGLFLLGKTLLPDLSDFDETSQFVGEMSDVNLWSTKLTPSMIDSVFQCKYEPKFSQPVAWKNDQLKLYDTATLIASPPLCGLVT